MGDTSGNLTRSLRTVTRSREEFDAATLIGRDGKGGRVLKALVDDVRVLRASLASAQIKALYESTL